MSRRALVEEAIYSSLLRLDAHDFVGFLDICDPEFRYTVGTYSPEIRQDMTWLDHDKAGLRTLFENLPRHKSDRALLTRHATVYSVSSPSDATEAKAITSLQVFRTTLDGGETQLFAVGKIHDSLRLADGQARLLRRDVKLTTRLLGIGSHIPF